MVGGSYLVTILTLNDDKTLTTEVIELASARGICQRSGQRDVGSKHASHWGLGQCAGWKYPD